MPALKPCVGFAPRSLAVFVATIVLPIALVPMLPSLPDSGGGR